MDIEIVSHIKCPNCDSPNHLATYFNHRFFDYPICMIYNCIDCRHKWYKKDTDMSMTQKNKNY